MSTATPTLTQARSNGMKLMKWRQEKGISREIFANMAHFSVRKLATYEKSEKLPEKVIRPVTETMRLIKALQELCGDTGELKVWLNSVNPAFDGKRPLDVIAAGRSDLLWEMVHQLRQGAFA